MKYSLCQLTVKCHLLNILMSFQKYTRVFYFTLQSIKLAPVADVVTSYGTSSILILFIVLCDIYVSVCVHVYMSVLVGARWEGEIGCIL